MCETQQLGSELEELRARLAEAEETLNAIRTGQVDAVVVHGPEGHAVYTLTGAERVYRLLVEAMNEGALVLAADGSIIYSNSTFAAMLGLPLEQVIGSTVFDYVAEPDRQSVTQLLNDALYMPGRREIALLRENAGHVPAHISVGGLNVEETESISAVVTDLTEHKALECELEKHRGHLEDLVEERTAQLKKTVEQLKVEIEARKAAEKLLGESRDDAEWRAAQLESFFSSMVDGVTLFDEDGKVVVMNDAGRAMFGIPDGAAYDDWTSYQRYTLEGDPIPLEDAVSFRALRGEIVRDVRYRAISPWGKDFIMSVSAAPVRDSSGGIIGATNVFRDVTDQVEYERRKNALFEREHRIAETLQHAMMPAQLPPAIDGWTLAARYQPALQEALVGGDFYDVFRLDDDRIAVLIGDVAGKGLAASIQVAAVRHAIRSYAYVNTSPAEIMQLTNDGLCREPVDVRNMLTAFFAILDVRTHTLTYASAGHEPPVVQNATGDVTELDVTGPMFGVSGELRYSEKAIKLEDGDSLVLMTDGITEARTRGGVMFEKEGVIARLTQISDASPDQIAEALLQAATLHAEGNLQDDVAIVVLGPSGRGAA